MSLIFIKSSSIVIVRITAKSWKNNLQRRLTYRPVNIPVEKH